MKNGIQELGDMDNNNLGAILRARRKERKLTLPRLSSLSGVTAMQIGHIEMEQSFPRRRTLRKLANPLGFGEVELMKLAGFTDADKDEATDMAEGKCPPHHFIIDSSNVGHCRYCPEVRDFGRLLEREGVFAVAGRRGSKARKEVLSDKRSAAAKKRWQDPERRAKHSAAMKAAWRDPEYRAKQNVTHASLPGRHHKKEEL